MNKIKINRKGFTLMELLIVIAIIVILVAVTIPVLGRQTDKAKETEDIANLRACYGEEQGRILTEGISINDALDEMMAVSIHFDGTNGTTNKRERFDDTYTITYTAEHVPSQSWTFGTD